MAKYIFDKTGLNLENYNCSLQANEIRKIIKRHSNEESEHKQGQRAITNEDILNIPKVIQNPTDIIRSDKDYDGKPAIHFVKQIGIEKTTVVAVVSDKHLDLRVQTEYVGIKKRNLATPINEQAFIHTPEATRGTVFNDIICNSEENVNTNLEKTKLSRKANPTYTLSDE